MWLAGGHHGVWDAVSSRYLARGLPPPLPWIPPALPLDSPCPSPRFPLPLALPPLRTEYMFNNTPIFTARGVEVIPFNDPCM